MIKNEYNGWYNYETWNCKLWLDNEYSTYQYMQEESKRIYDESEASEYSTKKENAVYNLSEFIKEYVEENTPEIPASMYSDLLNAAISEINFREIALAYMDDMSE
jgi:GTPase Era involved in 16S rRNA processing